MDTFLIHTPIHLLLPHETGRLLSRCASKEINIVKWGVYDPMIDIRRWQGDIASKGISLKREEAQKLLDALKIVLGEAEA